jgi:hypothetical protein
MEYDQSPILRNTFVPNTFWLIRRFVPETRSDVVPSTHKRVGSACDVLSIFDLPPPNDPITRTEKVTQIAPTTHVNPDQKFAGISFLFETTNDPNTPAKNSHARVSGE